MTTQSPHRIQVGVPIIAADGKKVGVVKETEGNYFKVDARWKRDYWLTNDEVVAADENAVRLAISSREVNDYKLSKPAGASEDALLSAEQRAAQRERIERDIMGGGGWR